MLIEGRAPTIVALVIVSAIALSGTRSSARANPQAAAGAAAGLAAEIDAIAALSGEPRSVSAAGLTRGETPLVSLENPAAFDTSAKARRVVIVGGLDGSQDSARMVLDAVRWFKTAAPQTLRRDWFVSALPFADPEGHARTRPYTFPPLKGFYDDPEQPESRYVWRWVAFQAPDLVVEVRAGTELKIQGSAGSGAPQSEPLPDGSLGRALADPANSSGLGPVESMLVAARPTDGATILRDVLSRASNRPSPIRTTIANRIGREALALARMIAQRYPQTPSISYIPALAWVHTLRLASITGDQSLRAKVIKDVEPWLSAQKPLFGERIQLTAVAGTMVFAELAKTRDGNADWAAKLAAEGFARAVAEKAPGVPQYGQGWTDDMYMGAVTLVGAGTAEGRDAAARLLTGYAAKLQRPEGLFNHAPNAPAAWGRGNGFAAFGLMETLAVLPTSHPARAALLDIYRRQMIAMKAQQAPDGMWRQVVDIPGSYREMSVTAMTLTVMARGVRLGWIDKSYLPVIQRAWRGLLTHVAEDGTVVDVCQSTGAGPTRRYYLDRPAITGADDRAGAMALGAALEMYELIKAK